MNRPGSNTGPSPLGAPIAISGAGALASGSATLDSITAVMRGTATPPSALPEVGLLLQSVVVERGAKTTDGDIVVAVLSPWFDIVKALEKDPNIAFQMSWRLWEEMVAGSHERAGAQVILTPRSGDRGRDVIATYQGIGTIRVIDQVKAYKLGHLVTANDVRALFGVVVADRASKGFLTTTSDFAPELRRDPFIAEQIGPRLELLNGTQLLAGLQKLAKK